MQKAHNNINWVNFPSVDTPLSQTNLNAMDRSIDTIDDRVVAFDTTKANQSDMLIAIKTITFDEPTGTFTITFFNGTTVQIDTDIEKIPVNFNYDDDPTSEHYQQLILQLDDGTYKYIDLSALITQYDFSNSTTIRFVISGGDVQAEIIDGSITGNKLQPNYLADITAQANIANQSAINSANSALLSQSWAEGGTGTRQDEDTSNSKYYADKARDTVAELLSAFGISVIGERLVFGATFEEQYDIDVVGTELQIFERV